MITRVVETVLATDVGVFRAFGHREEPGGLEHLTLVRGDLRDAGRAGVLTRVHSLGPALGAEENRGVVD